MCHVKFEGKCTELYHQLCYSLRYHGSDTLRVAMETDLMYIHMVIGYSKHPVKLCCVHLLVYTLVTLAYTGCTKAISVHVWQI